MRTVRWIVIACVACIGGVGCEASTKKAGASELAEDVRSLPINSENNPALYGNNAPAESEPAEQAEDEPQPTPSQGAEPDCETNVRGCAEVAPQK